MHSRSENSITPPPPNKYYVSACEPREAFPCLLRKAGNGEVIQGNVVFVLASERPSHPFLHSSQFWGCLASFP